VGDEEGDWITVKGVHILIEPGETAGEAFKRTTGREVGSVGKSKSQKTPAPKSGKNQGYAKDVVGKITTSELRDGKGQREVHKSLRERQAKTGIIANNKEKEAIDKYTGSGYPAMNTYKRTGTSEDLLKENISPEKARQMSETLEPYINRFDLPEGTVLYRGVGSYGKEALKLKEGDVYEDKGFQSFSARSEVATDYSKIASPMPIIRAVTTKGDKGLTIPLGENEVIMNPGKWKVVDTQIVNEVDDKERPWRGIKFQVITVVSAK